jgi:hypothetical protein
VSAAAGVVSAAASLAIGFIGERRQRHEASRLEDRSATSVLEEGDLQAVGDYLFNTLGAIRLGDYVADRSVREKTTQAIERISGFLGDPEGTSTVADEPTDMDASETVEMVLLEAEKQARLGNVWNSLAAVRRLVELQLRDAFPSIVGKRMSAGRMLGLVEQHLPPENDAVREMRPALAIANAAIHGEDITPEQALTAIGSIRYGLGRLTNPEPVT